METPNKEPLFDDNSTDTNDELTDSLQILEEDFIFQENLESVTNETPKQKQSFIDSMMQKSKQSITRLLNYLRRDNRSLITGLLVACAISCFATASIASMIQNQKIEEVEVYSSYKDYPYHNRNSFSHSEVNPFNDYSSIYYFDSNEISRSESIFSQLEQLLEQLFGGIWNSSSGSVNQIDLPNHLSRNDYLEEF